MLDNVVYLRQTFDNAMDVLPAADTEPSLPGPETLLAQFNHRYTAALSPVTYVVHMWYLWYTYVPQVHMCAVGSY